MLGLSFNGSENSLRSSHSQGGVGGSWIGVIATRLLGLLGTNYFPILKLNPTELCLEGFKNI